MIEWMISVTPIEQFDISTFMLLMADLGNTKLCKKPGK